MPVTNIWAMRAAAIGEWLRKLVAPFTASRRAE